MAPSSLPRVRSSLVWFVCAGLVFVWSACSLAIILGTLALGAGIYHGISPVSSHNMSCHWNSQQQGSEGQTAARKYVVRTRKSCHARDRRGQLDFRFDFRILDPPHKSTKAVQVSASCKVSRRDRDDTHNCTINIFFNFIPITSVELHSMLHCMV